MLAIDILDPRRLERGTKTGPPDRMIDDRRAALPDDRESFLSHAWRWT